MAEAHDVGHPDRAGQQCYRADAQEQRAERSLGGEGG
jgi:hypothetical protein